jgi:hypothetical protein
MKILAALILSLAPLSAFADVVLFAGNIAQADIPTGYEHYFEGKLTCPVSSDQ